MIIRSVNSYYDPITDRFRPLDRLECIDKGFIENDTGYTPEELVKISYYALSYHTLPEKLEGVSTSKGPLGIYRLSEYMKSKFDSTESGASRETECVRISDYVGYDFETNSFPTMEGKRLNTLYTRFGFLDPLDTPQEVDLVPIITSLPTPMVCFSDNDELDLKLHNRCMRYMIQSNLLPRTALEKFFTTHCWLDGYENLRAKQYLDNWDSLSNDTRYVVWYCICSHSIGEAEKAICFRHKLTDFPREYIRFIKLDILREYLLTKP